MTLLQMVSLQRRTMEKPKRPYSLFKRPTVKANTFIYYCRFRDENGDYMTKFPFAEFLKRVYDGASSKSSFRRPSTQSKR